MFLSQLRIDANHTPGRLWLRNSYRVHQRLCMAFPSKERKEDDEHFLKPYDPEDFPENRYIADKKKGEIGEEKLKHVHAPRDSNSGFLFRIDAQPRGNAVILVLSAMRPDWDYAFHNAEYLLGAPAQVKNYNPDFGKGQTLKFRLAANTTRRCSRKSKDSKGNPIDGRWVGKRIPVPFDKLKDWLISRGSKGGFAVDDVDVQSGYIYVDKRDGKTGKSRLLSVRYDGILTVIDPDRFRQTLVRGIGPGKAFGFGLLSVAPLK